MVLHRMPPEAAANPWGKRAQLPEATAIPGEATACGDSKTEGMPPEAAARSAVRDGSRFRKKSFDFKQLRDC